MVSITFTSCAHLGVPIHFPTSVLRPKITWEGPIIARAIQKITQDPNSALDHNNNNTKTRLRTILHYITYSLARTIVPSFPLSRVWHLLGLCYSRHLRLSSSHYLCEKILSRQRPRDPRHVLQLV